MQSASPFVYAPPVRERRIKLSNPRPPHPSERYSFHTGHMLAAMLAGALLILCPVALYLNANASPVAGPSYTLTATYAGKAYVLARKLTLDECTYSALADDDMRARKLTCSIEQ